MNTIIKKINTLIIPILALIIFATCITPFANIYADEGDSNQAGFPDWLPEWIEPYLTEERIEKVVNVQHIYDQNFDNDIYEIRGVNKDNKAVYIKIENYNNKQSTPLGQTSESGYIEVFVSDGDYNEATGYNEDYFRNRPHKEERGEITIDSYITHDNKTSYSVQIHSNIKTIDDGLASAMIPTMVHSYVAEANKMGKDSSVNFTVSNGKVENVEVEYSYTYESSEIKGLKSLFVENMLHDSEEHRKMVGGRIISRYLNGSNIPDEKIIFYPNGMTEKYSTIWTYGNPYATSSNNEKGSSYVIKREKNNYAGFYDKETGKLYKVQDATTDRTYWYNEAGQMYKVTYINSGKEVDITESFFESHQSLRNAQWDPLDEWSTSKTIRGGGGGAPWKMMLNYPMSLNGYLPLHDSLLTTALIKGDIDPYKYAELSGADPVKASIFAIKYCASKCIIDVKTAIANLVKRANNTVKQPVQDATRNVVGKFIKGKLRGKWQLICIDELQ